jgi:hypothetical protein
MHSNTIQRSSDNNNRSLQVFSHKALRCLARNGPSAEIRDFPRTYSPIAAASIFDAGVNVIASKTAELDARRILLVPSRWRLSLPLSTCLTVALTGRRAGGRAGAPSNQSTVPAYRNHLPIDRCAIVATRRCQERNDRHPGDDDDEKAAAASSPSRRRRYRNTNDTSLCPARSAYAP